MQQAFEQVEKSTAKFTEKMDEITEKIAQIDAKLRAVRTKLEPLEIQILDLASAMHKAENTLHTKLTKAKRVRKLYLQAETDREMQEYEKDYDTLMKDVHKLDKELTEMREKYEKLTAKEDKLLKEEMALEAQKAELYHEREKYISQVEQISRQLASRINRTKRER